MSESTGEALKPPHEAGGAPMVLRSGSIEIDPTREQVAVGGAPLALPSLSYRLLLALVTRAPDTVSKDELIAAVWNSNAVSDETLAQRVRLLRQALGERVSSGPQALLSAVRGKGYRWQLPVERVPRLAVAGGSGSAARARAANRVVSAPYARGAVAVIALLLVAGFGWWLRSAPETGGSPSTGPSRVAVLPFQAVEGQSHVALALEDSLRSRLVSVPTLAVRSRAASLRYEASGGPSATGSAGGIDMAVSGRVSVDETGQVRVAIEVIEVATDCLIWTDAFETALTVDGLIDLQVKIADQVGQALAVDIATYAQGSDDTPRLPTTSLEAYDAYLLGRYHTFRQTPANLARARQHLTSAVQIDPQFAEAWAALGWTWSFLGTSYGGRPPQQTYPNAREAALRALSLKPSLGDARSLHADILTWYDWDFVAAEAEYRKALALDPYNTLGYALLLSALERHAEALAMIERRLQHDGDDPYVMVNAAWRYLNAGELTEAIRMGRLSAEHPDAAPVLGLALLASGAVDEALQVFEADLRRRGREPVQLANLAITHYVARRPRAGDALAGELQVLSEQRYVSPVLLARVAFRAGRVDEGFAHLQQGLVERSRGMVFLRVMRALRGHRDDPRYRALLVKMGSSKAAPNHIEESQPQI